MAAMDQNQMQFIQSGINLLRAGQLDQAQRIFTEAHQQLPHHPEIIHLLGVVALQKRLYREATGWLAQAVSAQPGNVGYLNNFGLALHGAGDFEQAVRILTQAHQASPQDSGIATALGMALRALDRLPEAEQVLRSAIRLTPGYAKAHNNLGNVLQDAGRDAEAIACFDQAWALDPHYVDALVNRGYARLMQGDYVSGFQDYEARWRLPHNPPRQMPYPLWRGESLAGKVLHVHSEQGFGDSLQFVRFLPRLSADEIVLEVPVPLQRVFAGQSWPRVRVVPQGTVVTADCHVPLLSLPHRLGLASAAAEAIPYLRADITLTAEWNGRLPQGPKIALVWASEPSNPLVHRRKSLPMALLQAHLPSLAASWISLQRGPMPPAWAIDAGSQVTDFADTAAILSAVDAVLTIDTAVAHLAGAMGKPVSVLLPYVADWRWGRAANCNWYPAARLYRQRTIGDWQTPLVAALQDITKQLSLDQQA